MARFLVVLLGAQLDIIILIGTIVYGPKLPPALLGPGLLAHGIRPSTSLRIVMQRCFQLSGVIWLSACADWTTADLADVPRLSVADPPTAIESGIGVVTPFQIHVENVGTMATELRLAEAALVDTDERFGPRSIAVVPTASVLEVPSDSTRRWVLEVTPNVALVGGALRLWLETEPSAWPNPLIINVPIQVAADWDADGADHGG